MAAQAGGTPGVSPFWAAVQRCEEPATGWTTRGSHYEGGVGFYVGTWRLWAGELGLVKRYPHAWMAPPAVQARVAHFGYVRGGYWGCIHDHASIRALPGA